MGQHKRNPTAIAAKNGELTPKKPSKRELDTRFEEYISEHLCRRMLNYEKALLRACILPPLKQKGD